MQKKLQKISFICSTNDGKNIGLIPMNYIDIVLKKSPDVCETVFNEAVSQ